jgi:hypothetical protein
MRQIAGPPIITTCPHCSVLVQGSCVPCADGQQHPACEECVGGFYTPPWYRNSTTLAILTTVVVSVVSGLIVTKVNGMLTASKRR